VVPPRARKQSQPPQPPEGPVPADPAPPYADEATQAPPPDDEPAVLDPTPIEAGPEAAESATRPEPAPVDASPAGSAPAASIEEAHRIEDAHPTEADTLVIAVPPPPAPDDLALRLARLEAENAELRGQIAKGAVPAAAPPRHRVRQWTAVVLIAIGALLAPLGLVASWAERTLTDTDRYLETVAPLADDPQVQQAIINRTVTTVMSNIDVSAVTSELQEFLVEQGAPPRLTDRIDLLNAPLTSGVQTLVTRVVTDFVTSDSFSSLWTQVNRVAQTQIVAILNGDPNTVVQLDDEGYLSLQLGPIIDIVKEQLVANGLEIAARIPAVNPTVPIAQADGLSQLRTGYNVLDTLGTWLPWLALMFLVAGVLVSTRRMRMTVVAALSVVGGMVLLAIGLAVGKEAVLGSLPATSSGGAVTVLYEQIVQFMRIAIRMVAVVGLVVALFAFLAGGSAAALATRRSAGNGFETVRSWGRGKGVDTGGFGVWLGARRTLIRWLLIAIGVLVIIAADTPTAGLVIWTTVIILVVIGIVELLSASPNVVAAPSVNER
jgi:hypothetical protein